MFRIRTVLAGAAVAAAAVLAVAAPAAAHDELVQSTPAADEQLTVAPEQVVLTFSNNLLSLEDNSGTAMTVVDSTGQDWVAGEPVVQADTVTVPLDEGMPNGDYTVTWKVVSSDGHPTDGEYAFSLAAEDAEASAEPADEASDEPSDQPTAEQTPASASEDGDSALAPVLWGVGGLIVVAAIVTAVMVARKRRA
ncbi:copper resistance protein CopC [Microbacterium sp. NPDC058345]|uniref:copper resistance CopC family protein n=1 Tax=Microbacterium sp. NPDC058345 TaxID=3346455 RepID=UPI003664DDFC